MQISHQDWILAYARMTVRIELTGKSSPHFVTPHLMRGPFFLTWMPHQVRHDMVDTASDRKGLHALLNC